MSMTEDFEALAESALAGVVAADGTLGALVLQRFGLRGPVAERTKEWLALDVLTVPRMAARTGVWKGEFLFQVSCFQRGASDRSDGKLDKGARLAGRVRAALENSSVAVKDLGESAQPTLALLQVGVPRTQKVPPDDGGDVWAVVVSFTAFVQSA